MSDTPLENPHAAKVVPTPSSAEEGGASSSMPSVSSLDPSEGGEIENRKSKIGNPYWHTGPDLLALRHLPVPADPALRRLGDSPFTRAGFPIIGFLETLYEQVAAYAQARRPPNP